MGCCGCAVEDKETRDIGNGLTKNRGCTDILCCVLYMGFVGFWMFISITAFTNGNPYQLIKPTDSNGNICGYGEKKNESVLLYFDVLKCTSVGSLATSNMQCPTYQMCREECPSTYYSYFTNTLPSLTAWSVSNGLGANLSLGEWRCENANVQDLCLNMEPVICKPQVQALWENYFSRTDSGVVEEVTSLFVNGECALYYYPSDKSLGRCMPTMSVNDTETDAILDENEVQISADDTLTAAELRDGYSTLLKSEATDFGKKSLADLQESWPVILILMAVAAIVSFLWVFLMRWVAAPLIWIFVVGLLALMGYGIYFCYNKYDLLSNASAADVIEIETLLQEFTFDFAQYLQVKEVWLGFLITLSIITAIYFLMLLFFIKRIRIATRLLAEASKAVGSIMTTLIFPFFTTIFHMAVTIYFVATASYIASSSTAVFKVLNSTEQSNNSFPAFGESCDINEWDKPTHPEFNNSQLSCQFSEYVGDYGFTNSTVVIQLINLFGFYWTMNLVTAIGQCTLAGAFASWYFAFNKPADVPRLPLLSSFLRSFWHLGTLAFGSLIIAIVQTVRAVLDYIDRKTKASQTTIVKALLCCCKCCLWCLEKCLRYISKNAYILTAMFGYNFCQSSCKAIKLIVANAGRAVALDGTTGFMLFVGKLFVALGCGALTWAFFSGTFQLNDSWLQAINVDPSSINAVWLPTLIVTVGAYIIALGFFNVYSMAVSTVFLCFLQDLELNDGSVEKPYFMSKSLMSIMGKKNKKEKPGESEM